MKRFADQTVPVILPAGNSRASADAASASPVLLAGAERRIDAAIPVAGGVFGELTPAMAAAVPESEHRRFCNARLLRQAGYLNPVAWVNLAAMRYAMTIGSILVLGTCLLVAGSAWEPFLVAALVGVPFVTWFAPLSIVRRQAARRLAEIHRGIPDLMALMSYCVLAGMDVPTAFARAGSDLVEVYPALAQEVSLTSIHADVGTFAHALRALRARIDTQPVATLTSVLIQSAEIGSEVCSSLERYSRNLRELEWQQRESLMRLTPVRMIAPTVLFLVPAALLLFFAPQIVQHFAEIDFAIGEIPLR